MAEKISHLADLYHLMDEGNLVALIAYVSDCEFGLPYDDMRQSLPGLEFAEVDLEEDTSTFQAFHIGPGEVAFFRNGEMVSDPVPVTPETIEEVYWNLMD